MNDIQKLKEKAKWVKAETLKIHKLAPESRIASSLSDIETFVALYYGGILNYDPQNVFSQDRDRFIVSKGHGAVSMYPILADLGFFAKEELENVGQKDSFLCVIPDTAVPGFETINGSLGHGLGVACGVAIALKRKNLDSKVYVLCGDGELNEGAVWEGVMFAACHKLDNLVFIVDNNQISMLGYQKDIMALDPLDSKFKAFGWETASVDGHDIEQLISALTLFKTNDNNRPKALIANTRKGNGVEGLQDHPMSHVMTLKPDRIDEILEKMK
ncbi:MAG: transketolase [Anaerohalosphaera sp.]|nr:transketolase [Anaerohalosphaera sp.]